MLINIIIFSLTALIAFTVGIAYEKKKAEKKMEELTEEINHFLLYFEYPEESLKEGFIYNLANQVRKLETQLLHEQNSAQKREKEFTHFIENMAHQMKTTVTALQLHLDLAEIHAKTEEETAALSKSQKSLARLTAEVSQLLTSSQLASGKIIMNYEEFHICELLSDCLFQLNSLASRKEITFQTKVASDMILYGDPFWLSQATENILKNAIEHTKYGGIIEILFQDNEKEIEICIKDQGAGIPPEELPHLFQRFHRGSFSKSGYGIGLHMAFDIVKAHHGTLTAGNLPEEGAYFLITLPQLTGTRIYSSSKK